MHCWSRESEVRGRSPPARRLAKPCTRLWLRLPPDHVSWSHFQETAQEKKIWNSWIWLTLNVCQASCLLSPTQIYFTRISHSVAGLHKSESSVGEGPSVANLPVSQIPAEWVVICGRDSRFGNRQGVSLRSVASLPAKYPEELAAKVRRICQVFWVQQRVLSIQSK